MKKALLLLILVVTSLMPTPARADIKTALGIAAGAFGVAVVCEGLYQAHQGALYAYLWAKRTIRNGKRFCTTKPWWPIAGIVTAGCVAYALNQAKYPTIEAPL